MRVLFCGVAALALIAANGQVHASDVFSAPVPAPTIGTETVRGQDLGAACRQRAGNSVKTIWECIQNIRRRQEQQATLTEPFLLGLYFSAVTIVVPVLGHPLSRLDRETCKFYISTVDKDAQSFKLTDAQMIDEFHMLPQAETLFVEARKRCR